MPARHNPLEPLKVQGPSLIFSSEQPVGVQMGAAHGRPALAGQVMGVAGRPLVQAVN